METNNNNKFYFLLSSSKPIVSVAWYLNNLLNIKLSQKIIEIKNQKNIFFEYKTQNYRVALFPAKFLNISPKLKKLDYLLIIENIQISNINFLKDPQFINYILPINYSNVPKSTIKQIEKL